MNMEVGMKYKFHYKMARLNKNLQIQISENTIGFVKVKMFKVWQANDQNRKGKTLLQHLFHQILLDISNKLTISILSYYLQSVVLFAIKTR